HMLRLWANVCIVESGEGIALFDVGLPFHGPRIVEELRRLTDKPVLYIIYGHGHADHAFGTPFLLRDAEERGHPRPHVIAHEALPRRFDRYRRMLPYHERINRMQFDIPEGIPAFPWEYVYPDETVRDETTIRFGEITLKLRHARGETDDHLWLWIPERRVACVSDFWVWSCPNVGNPFKVQRYALEWAMALEQVAERSPEVMLPGHGNPLAGEEAVKEACLEVSGALKHLDQQVVDMLNQGLWPEEILHSFTWPEEYAGSPYLAPIYGHPYFVIQALLREYHGWYDGNPSHLFPAAEAEIAREVLALAGGGERVLARAKELEERGDLQLSLHLLDFILAGGGDGRREAMKAKVRILERMAGEERSLIARNIFLAGARELRKRLEAPEAGGED
ncbi:MAG: alkyl sulfatase dimerization domain-containing protein, partial [Actinomycetota bacterium]|nr:alkyl sulfatase dimerization domain-containing protein [Actinomycetota bacterium]